MRNNFAKIFQFKYEWSSVSSMEYIKVDNFAIDEFRKERIIVAEVPLLV